MKFMSLSRRRSSSRNVPSGEERGETDVFAGYKELSSFLLETIRELKSKCVTPLLLGPLLETRQNGQFFPLSLVKVPEVFAQVTSAQFPSRF